MNSRDLRSFTISLKHHLAEETELFDAGLIDHPAVTTRENAKKADIVVFAAEPTVRVLGRHIKGANFSREPRRRIRHNEPTTDFSIELKKRTENPWDLNPRRRV